MEIKDTLNSLGMKSTPARMLVLEVLSKNKKPMAVQEIADVLKKKYIDLATIYRTIASFEKAELIHRVDLRTDMVLYELRSEQHHHHIVCTSCGDMEDFELCDMENVSKKIVSKSHKFNSVKEHNFELFGLCNACAK